MMGKKDIPVRINSSMIVYTDDKKNIPSILKKYSKYLDKSILDSEDESGGIIDIDNDPEFSF
jgi:hypothetical protein